MLGSQGRKNRRLVQLLDRGQKDDSVVDEIVSLLNRGADANVRADSGHALWWLVHNWKDDEAAALVVTALLRHGAELNSSGSYDHLTPVHKAAALGHLDKLAALLEAEEGRGAILIGGYQLTTPVMYAMEKKKWEAVRMLLSSPRGEESLSIADSQGVTPLMSAIQHGAPMNIIHEILSVDGVDVNAADRSKNAAIHAAVKSNVLQYLEVVLAHPKVNVDLPGEYGRTALHVALDMGYSAMVDALLEKGASVSQPDGSGHDALYHAASAGDLALFEMILRVTLKERLNIDKALAGAAAHGHVPIVQRLLAEGADVNNASVGNGRTPLMLAALEGCVDVISLLLEKGARLDMKDKEGRTAYDLAVSGKHEGAIKMLDRLRGGVTVTAEDDKRYVKISDTGIEIQDGDRLSTIFNFWTGQVIYRDPATGGMTAQSFADVPRKEAIEEARLKLLSMGGHPPETDFTAIDKKKRMPGLGVV